MLAWNANIVVSCHYFLVFASSPHCSHQSTSFRSSDSKELLTSCVCFHACSDLKSLLGISGEDLYLRSGIDLGVAPGHKAALANHAEHDSLTLVSYGDPSQYAPLLTTEHNHF